MGAFFAPLLVISEATLYSLGAVFALRPGVFLTLNRGFSPDRSPD